MALAWVAGQVPSRGHARGNHTVMFPSLPPFPLFKINKLFKKIKKNTLQPNGGIILGKRKGKFLLKQFYKGKTYRIKKVAMRKTIHVRLEKNTDLLL